MVVLTLCSKDLFTEQKRSAPLPVLFERAGIYRLLQLWRPVLVTTLTVASVFAAVVSIKNLRMGVIAIEIVVQLPGAVTARWLMDPLA